MTHGTLALLGSGETGPGMVRVYRDLFAALGTVRGLNLNSAYGFQENVPQLNEKIEDFFLTSLQTRVPSENFLRADGTSDVERALVHQHVREANFVFAGPGSPSYALTQWRALDLTPDLHAVLDAGGVVSFASAAALTLGSHTAPIYEIYKVGETPQWLEGLDLLSRFGLRAAIIPHYDNAEGGNHDTRYCYLGAGRLARLESMLPEDTAILGIDEHTALIIDEASDELRVTGRGHAYWRRHGEELVLSSDEATPLDRLRSFSPPARAPQSTPTETSGPLALAEVVARGGEAATAALAQLVALATTGGAGFIDPTPLADGILRARVQARSAGAYDVADALRAVLTDAGFQVADSAEGSTWSLPSA